MDESGSLGLVVDFGVTCNHGPHHVVNEPRRFLADDAAILVLVYKRITSELERFRSTSKFEDAEVVS